MVDSAFGTNGVTSLIYPTFQALQLIDMHCQTDDKIIGQIYGLNNDRNTVYSWNLFRLTKNGIIDSTFGDNGFIINSQYPELSRAMIVLPNNDIITAGYSVKDFGTYYIDYIRLNKYNKNGVLIQKDSVKIEGNLFTGDDFKNMELKLTSDGKLVMAFFAYLDAYPKIVLYRFKASGTIDSSFNQGKIKYISIGGFYALPNFGALAIDANNKILIGLSNVNHFNVTRLNIDGTTDKTFGSNGLAEIVFFKDARVKNADVYDLLVQPDNKIIALGDVSGERYKHWFALARFKENGMPDSSFGDEGRTVTRFFWNDGEPDQGEGYAMKLLPDGRFVAVGSGLFRPVFARYIPEKLSKNIIAKAPIISSLKTTTPTISIAPNPVKNILNISSKNLSYKNISVIDASGKVVLKDGFAGSNHSINVSGLSAGVYYVQVTNANNNIETIKLIKQ